MTPIPSLRGKRRARIEIIPLIDIIFFLLATFVMVSLSMVKNRGIPVTLPTASTGTPQEPGAFATISIDAAGNLFFNKQPVTTAQLGDDLKELLIGDSDPRVFINGDAKAQFGQAIGVLDQVRALGISHVAIETQPIQAKAAP
jgi:biopolymer transport protein ExbD